MFTRLIFILLGILPITVFGQTLRGEVKDADNELLSDVHVHIPNANIHSHTNAQGQFELTEIKLGDTLRFTYLGYEDQLIVIQQLEEILKVELEFSPFLLDDVVIRPDVKAINLVTAIDLQTAPVKSSQEILQKIPGLVIGQHAGGGKAEQIFLRGFDIDHGTDINISVDGLPVNMVSHAHGQGYADLHFVIPETVDKIDFGKGPYYADKGNFSTAGYVAFETKSALEQSSIQFERGQFNRMRAVGLFDLINTDKNQAYIATEYTTTDGFFESAQGFKRINVFGKYTSTLENRDKISILASVFDSKWDASGQIPQRAIDSGLITRFGAIDDTEGGKTGRKNLKLDYTKFLTANSNIKNSIYFSQYDFELYSNFTFFLNNPIDGDQIRQKEKRNIFGLSSEWNYAFSDHLLKVSAGLRNDQSKDNELSRTKNRRTTLEQVQFGDINETNIFTAIEVDFTFGKWLLNTGLRLDYFDFQYNDHLQINYETQKVNQTKINPKLNLIYQHSNQLQTYVKLGTSFHSNDTRVVVAQTEKEVLPTANGADLGLIWKPLPRLFINSAIWYLFLEQEFVYVGDEGVVEPSGKTQRTGFDFGARYQLTDWLFAYFDINTANAQSLESNKSERFIPLAPGLTSSGGITVNHASGITGSIRYRHLKNRPANEDYSIEATGYSIIDLNLNYAFRKISFGIDIDNLLNTEWIETQFATESRLLNEPISIEEIHFTPGTPFSLSGKIIYRF